MPGSDPDRAGFERPPHKFDPARADLLDAADRDEYLPDATVVALLELDGTETVVDYGAGTGRVARAAAERLPRGRVIAIDESQEMEARLRERVADHPNVEVLTIGDNRVELPEQSADRILAVNLLHEIRGETALAEMRRLLKPTGMLLVIDWDRERPSEPGPPVEHRYSVAEAERELAAAGFEVRRHPAELPYHFVLRATVAAAS